MKKILIISFYLIALSSLAQSSGNKCLDSRCQYLVPIMPGGYYYDYGYSDYLLSNLHNLKKDEPLTRLNNFLNTSGSNLKYQIYIAKNGSWKLIGNIFLCMNHSSKTLYFKPGFRYAVGIHDDEPLELKIPQPKTWKVK